MAQPEKRENSVLFSLRELKQIEQKRVQDEEQRRQDAETAVVRAQQEAEQRRQDAEKAAEQAKRDAERMAAEAAERKLREEALRIQEAEARARVEAQANLEASRLAAEMDIRRTEANRKRPIKQIAAAAAVLVAVAAFIGVRAMQHASEKDKAAQVAQAEKAKAEDEMRKYGEQVEQMQAEVAASAKEIREAEAALASAQSQADRDAANAKIAAAKKAAAEREAVLAELREKQRKAGLKVNTSDRCIKNPLADGC